MDRYDIPCPCGNSPTYSYPLYDARGIYVARVCDQCEEKKKLSYRPDIFTDSQYWADEPIEE